MFASVRIPSLTRGLAASGAALCLTLYAAASAKVICVNKETVGVTHDGASWATAFQTVQAGINAAASGDELWVAKATYAENITLKAGIALYGGFAGTETARSQRNWSANLTALESSIGNVVTCQSQSITLDGFTIRNGYGGVKVDAGAKVLLTDDTIADNSVYGVNVSSGTATLSRNTMSGNGYAVYVYATGTATLLDSIVYGNGYGVSVSGTATLVNNTITGSGYDGVYVPFGKANIANNIIAFNSGYGVNRGSSGSISAFSHNDVYGNTGGDYAGYSTPAGSVNISQDPTFADQAGGDYHLIAGSPCIDAGDDTAVTPGETDFEGRPRIIGPFVDIGAYEFGILAPYTLDDIAGVLKVTGGMVGGTPGEMFRMNPEAPLDRVDLNDAVRIARKVAGLEPNP